MVWLGYITKSQCDQCLKEGNTVTGALSTAQARGGKQLKAADFKPYAVMGSLERVETEASLMTERSPLQFPTQAASYSGPAHLFP